jgi:hypothetical protein
MKLVAIGGIPGTGKTHLIHNLLKQSDDWIVYCPIKLLDGLWSEKLQMFVIGKYSPYYPIDKSEIFQGTDKLAMNVQPSFTKFILESKEKNIKVVFEGDRLFNSSTFNTYLEHCPNGFPKIIILHVSLGKIKDRYKERGSDQSEKFLKSRQTKIDNISGNMDLMDFMRFEQHETLEDTETVVGSIINF